jgi:hypothetical protein
MPGQSCALYAQENCARLLLRLFASSPQVVRATWATDSVASVRVSCLGEELTLLCLSCQHGQVSTGGIPPDVGHRDGPPVGARLASSALGSAQELAAALGNNDAFAATVITRLADKASLLVGLGTRADEAAAAAAAALGLGLHEGRLDAAESELDAELEAAQDVRIAAAPETGGYAHRACRWWRLPRGRSWTRETA